MRQILAAFAILFTAPLTGIFSSSAAAENTSATTNIPIEAFSSLPNYEGVKLSPNSKRLGYFLPLEGRQALIVQMLDGSERFYVPPIDEGVDYDAFYWKSDDMLIMKASMTLNRLNFRGKSHETRTISLHVPTKEFKWLGKPKSQKNDYASQHERIVDFLPNEPDHILMQLDLELDGSPTVYKTNIKTGRRKTAKRGKSGIQNWYTDHKSEVRLGVGYTTSSSKYRATFKNAEGKWIDLTKLNWKKYYDIMGFTDDLNVIYVTGYNAAGMDSLYKLDILSGKIVEEVYSSDNVDVLGTFDHPETGRVAGVRFIDDFHRTVYFDSAYKRLQRGLTRALPGEVVTITGSGTTAQHYLILAESDTNPGDYYFYDGSKKQLSYILSKRAEIDAEKMAAVKKLDIPVRDGSEIPAYLALPNGSESKNLPTVILPHGGPRARDTAAWDYEAQFYASRGYAVLKPNFRGSSGYGILFQNKGKKQWGGLMQDDVTDATKWLIKEGIADPDRICIVGNSYGGYASLMGVIKEPDLYKCAISVNGVTDLVKLKREDRHVIGGKNWIKNMGFEGANDKSVSPYHRAEDISAPVLIIAAKDDARIPYKHSKALHKRLKRLKKSSEYVELENGTHYMVTAEARLETLKAAEKFLAKHIGD